MSDEPNEHDKSCSSCGESLEDCECGEQCKNCGEHWSLCQCDECEDE